MTSARALSVPELPRILAIAAIVVMAAVAGLKASWLVLFSLLAAVGSLVLLRHLELLLFAIVFAALLVPLEISTGTEVALNASAFLVPVGAVLWLVAMTGKRTVALAASRLNRPLLAFLLAGLFSLLIGNVLWDPAVPRASSFILVQLAQWAIVVFSAAALLLTGNLIKEERRLRQLTFFLLLTGGALTFLYVTPSLATVVQLHRVITVAFIRAPFWVLLAALAGGQLLFNRQLTAPWRFVCIVVIASTLVFCFLRQFEVLSNWIGVVTALAMLAWLRWPRLRLPVIGVILLLLATGFLLPTIYEFAGGEAEWNESGGSRLVLIGRVLEMTWKNNPITGLGPAAYRPYGFIEPLKYFRALWFEPRISSHNNYVDLFAHFGLVGLVLFFWFVYEVARLGLKLRARFTSGFRAGYVNGILAAGVGSLIIMLLADWILPFVYNIGFPGFQASVLVWLFTGGLVALEQIAEKEGSDG